VGGFASHFFQRVPGRRVLFRPPKTDHFKTDFPNNKKLGTSGYVVWPCTDLRELSLGIRATINLVNMQAIYVDFRDRGGTQKPFFVWHRKDPRGSPPPQKWPQSRSPIAMTLDFCRKFRTKPVQRGPGADLGHKTAQNSKPLRSAGPGLREHKHT
jgi:hypothetical protein